MTEEKKPEFTWEDDEEDNELFNYGVTFMWVSGIREAIQTFVEALSNEIGHKVDWSYTADSAHIDVMYDGMDKAQEFINNNPEFIARFEKEYDFDNPSNNNMYFHRIG
jgi:hypothetical protein